MNRYYVTVNGTRYEVEVEEVQGEFEGVKEESLSLDKKETSKPVKAVKKVAHHGEKIECPMPGTILKININSGDTFKKGDILFILEAMKMENEIMAPHDGKIVEVQVQKGASVNTGDVLAIIE